MGTYRSECANIRVGSFGDRSKSFSRGDSDNVRVSIVSEAKAVVVPSPHLIHPSTLRPGKAHANNGSIGLRKDRVTNQDDIVQPKEAVATTTTTKESKSNRHQHPRWQGQPPPPNEARANINTNKGSKDKGHAKRQPTITNAGGKVYFMKQENGVWG